MARILVISPHPDDEALGCGGAMIRHAASGDAVDVIHLTSGEKGGHGLGEDETRRVRESEAEEAARILGVREVEFWREPDGRLRVAGRVVQRMARALSSRRPDLVYVPHAGEMHADHRAALRVLQEAWPDHASGKGARIRMYEVWTPLQRMDHVEDISDVIETKMAAVRAYRCQDAVIGFDDAFRGLARYRGELFSWPEGTHAEIFAHPRKRRGRAS